METDKPPRCLDLQLATNQPELCPSEGAILAWCLLALPANLPAGTELTLRFVDEAESQQLNNEYRGNKKQTNVLSSLYESSIDLPAEAELSLLGDLVICLPKVIAEAAEQQKPVLDH